MNGVLALRLTADAVTELWRDEGVAGDLRDDSLAALQGIELGVVGWYEIMAAALSGVGRVPEPLAADAGQLERLAAVAAESRDDDQAGRGRRVLWVGDHLDAARRLQALVAPPAAVVARDARAR